MDEKRGLRRHFPEARLQASVRDVPRAMQVGPGIFRGTPHIEKAVVIAVRKERGHFGKSDAPGGIHRAFRRRAQGVGG